MRLLCKKLHSERRHFLFTFYIWGILIIVFFHGKTLDIIAKLWRLCNVLREAGITYPEYVTELTYLILLKMAHETGRDEQLPKGFRWWDLSEKPSSQQFAFYQRILQRCRLHPSGRVATWFVLRKGVDDISDARIIASIREDAGDAEITGLTSREFLHVPMFRMIERHCLNGNNRLLLFIRDVATQAVPQTTGN
jgi:hypothetical protein